MDGVTNQRKLFVGSCMALVATSVAFGVVTAIIPDLKAEFTFTNAEVGRIGGAAIWGFAVSQLLFAPFCDTLGMRRLLKLAFVCHLLGVVLFLTGAGFTQLFLGALIIAIANGLVEAACNPLVASIYPENKTIKLNQFHVWFPAGIVIGAVASRLLDAVGIGAWQVRIAIVFIPTLIYGWVLLRENFPETEGVRAGVSMGATFRASLTTPLMLLLLFCMIITASSEIAPGRWVTAVLESGGIDGTLVLAWIYGLMAILRWRASLAVKRLSPTGVLTLSAVLASMGLLWMSYVETTLAAFAAATVFAAGVCYFWPTMLGVVSERVPRSGALGLGLMGAVGMGVAGLFTVSMMGEIADREGHERLPVVETTAFLEEAAAMLHPEVPGSPNDVDAGNAVRAALDAIGPDGALPELTTADALRAVINSDGVPEMADRAGAILNPADNYGGRISFRYLVPFTALVILIFAAMYMRDRRAGGYRPVRLSSDS